MATAGSCCAAHNLPLFLCHYQQRQASLTSLPLNTACSYWAFLLVLVCHHYQLLLLFILLFIVPLSRKCYRRQIDTEPPNPTDAAPAACRPDRTIYETPCRVFSSLSYFLLFLPLLHTDTHTLILIDDRMSQEEG